MTRSPFRLALLGALALLTAAGAQPGIPALPPRTQAAVQGPEMLPEIPPAPSSPVRPTSPGTPGTVSPGVPSDPLYARQWNLPAIHLPDAWALGRGGPVTVAVLDTGFVNSPELSGRVVNGYDFVSDAARAGDGSGRDADATAVGPFAYHGEIIANLIGAAQDGRGMVGINPAARIVHVRVAAPDGTIELQDLIDALKWSAGLSVPGVPVNQNPARLLNLSLFVDFDGYPRPLPLTGCDARLQTAIDAVTARGALLVAGAANDGADARGYSPAGCRNVLTVTSVTEAGQRPGYANWGRSVALAAPGGEPGHGIVASSVTGPGGERTPNGTSFAAPHVTGVASLLLAVRPKLSVASLRADLTRSATPFPGGACDPEPERSCGSGTLNAAAALKLALASSLGR